MLQEAGLLVLGSLKVTMVDGKQLCRILGRKVEMRRIEIWAALGESVLMA